MTGRQFQVLLEHFFANKGYRVARLGVRRSSGAGLLLEGTNGRTIVQVKRWTGVVRHEAVQEAAVAKAHYGAARALVVTSSNYSQQAVTVANSNGVTLWNRTILASELAEFRGRLRCQEVLIGPTRRLPDMSGLRGSPVRGSGCRQCAHGVGTKDRGIGHRQTAISSPPSQGQDRCSPSTAPTPAGSPSPMKWLSTTGASRLSNSPASQAPSRPAGPTTDRLPPAPPRPPCSTIAFPRRRPTGRTRRGSARARRSSRSGAARNCADATTDGRCDRVGPRGAFLNAGGPDAEARAAARAGSNGLRKALAGTSQRPDGSRTSFHAVVGGGETPT